MTNTGDKNTGDKKTGDAKTGDDFLKKAKEHFKKGEFEEAVKSWTQAITWYKKNDPESQHLPSAYSDRGNAYFNLKQYDKAIKDYDKAIEIDPQLAPAYNNRGTTYYDLKQYDNAIADCTQAITIDPQLALAYNNRGNTYNNLKQYDKAIADFTQAIDLDPKLALAYNNRGTAYASRKQYDKAIADYSKVYELGYTTSLPYIAFTIKNLKELEENKQNELFKLMYTLQEKIVAIKKLHVINKEETKEKDSIKHFAHYTKFNIIKEILDPDKLPIAWLGNTASMNDPKEGKILYEKIIPSLKEFYNTEDSPFGTFMMSFVAEEDIDKEGDNALTLWRYYGDDSRGAKLVLPKSAFDTELDNSVKTRDLSSTIDASGKRQTASPSSNKAQPVSRTLYKVFYYDELKSSIDGELNFLNYQEEASTEDNNIRDLYDRLKNTVQELINFKKGLTKKGLTKEEERNRNTINKLVRLVVNEISFLYKSRFYHSEEEYRLVEIRLLNDDKVTPHPDPSNRRLHIETEEAFLMHDGEDKRYIFIGANHSNKEERAYLKRKLLIKEYNCDVKVSRIDYIPPREEEKIPPPETQ